MAVGAASSSSSPATSLPALDRVEVRPIAIPLTSAGDAAARAWLGARQVSREKVSVGEVFVTNGWEFGVVACEPQKSGLVNQATELCVGSQTLPLLKRLQLTLMRLPQVSEEAENAIYDGFVRPYLLRRRAEMNLRGGKVLRLMTIDEVVDMDGHSFGVRALDPSGRHGALTESTDVFVEHVESPALARIHALPYEDSLPRAYAFDLFGDFLRPFFQEHPFAVFGEGDHFTYRSVRFRVMATDPPGTAARVSTETLVFSEGEPLRPTVWDLLPPELRTELRRLPRGLQMLLLNTMAHEDAVQGRLTEVDSVLRRGQGLTASQLAGCGEEIQWSAAAREKASREAQTQCMVCLSDFADDDTVLRLDCEHLFHKQCVHEWLQRSASCPICKRPVAAGGRGGVSQPGSRDTGIQLLAGSRVSWNGGRERGVVVGADSASRKLRVSAESGGAEQLVALDSTAQLLRGVRLIGLQSAPQLNGAVVQVVGLDDTGARYLAQVEGTERTVSITPEHCIFPAGAVVRVADLQQGERWNGRFGRIVRYDGALGRHVVAIHPRGNLLSIRSGSLRV